MTNAEWMIKNGYKFKNVDIKQRPRDFFIYEVYIGNALIDTYRCTNEITYWDVITNWLDMEHKEPILDDSEREYLSAVIKPFRPRVKYIVKLGSGREWIKIDLRGSEIYFPPFEMGTMYKGMELFRHYTLKELGL